MSNILTPLSLWKNFEASLPVQAEIKATAESEGIIFERVRFYGREVNCERVNIAAVFAYNAKSPSKETVMIFPDSSKSIDEEVLRMFVSRGFSAIMIDYRGEWQNCDFYTVYPEEIEYANTAKCGRSKDYVDESADKTCWYEWVAIGVYARKYVTERTCNGTVAAVGIRDGGEIVWKLSVACRLAGIVPVCAAGWKAYADKSKYLPEEPKLDDERYRFIAGIDSQAYAPHVQCPVLMLCSTNDMQFDYDRAYDTFSRINPEYTDAGAISYSIGCDGKIGETGLTDMFMFLDRNLKNRQVFIPESAEVSVEVDEEDNLIAKAVFDGQGIVENCSVYLAEENVYSALRDWTSCPLKKKVSSNEHHFYLNVYEKTNTVFVFCNVKYTNGFSVWSKIVVKKLSGAFRNMQGKSSVIFSGRNDGTDGFSVINTESSSIGGIFLDSVIRPSIVTKAKDIKGITCPGGISTMRMNNPRFAPVGGNALSVDVFCDRSSNVILRLSDMKTGEEFIRQINVWGGVWQSVISEAKDFKTQSGIQLSDFNGNFKFSFVCSDSDYAVNNIMWL